MHNAKKQRVQTPSRIETSLASTAAVPAPNLTATINSMAANANASTNAHAHVQAAAHPAMSKHSQTDKLSRQNPASSSQQPQQSRQQLTNDMKEHHTPRSTSLTGQMRSANNSATAADHRREKRRRELVDRLHRTSNDIYAKRDR